MGPSRPLVELPTDENLLLKPRIGVYMVTYQSKLYDCKELPYYVGSGDLAGELYMHLRKWTTGEHSVWDIDADCGTGLTKKGSQGSNGLIWYPVRGKALKVDTQSWILNWVVRHLRYAWFETGNKDEALRIEGEMIERLAECCRLANARNEAVALRRERPVELSDYTKMYADQHAIWRIAAASLRP